MAQAAEAHDIAGMSSGNTDQFLTFSLSGEEYGVDILDVQEVKVWTNVTQLPNTPPYVKGVLNLRGSVVPVIDLRICFGIESIDYNDTTVIVVLKLNIGNEDRIVGLVVDAVSDVLDIDKDKIRSTNEFDLTQNTESITGVATLENKMVILLDPSRLIGEGELSTLASSAESVKAQAEVTEGT